MMRGWRDPNLPPPSKGPWDFVGWGREKARAAVAKRTKPTIIGYVVVTAFVAYALFRR